MKHAVISLALMTCTAACYRHNDQEEIADASDNTTDGPATANEGTEKATNPGVPPDGEPDDGVSITSTDTATQADTIIPPLECCIGAIITWGTDCGMGHIDAIFLLPSCESRNLDPAPGFCVAELPMCPDDDLVDASDINRLLKAPDFQEALNDDVSTYGVMRTQYFFIRIALDGNEDDRMFGVGDPCDDDATECTPIPKSVTELKSLLDTIVGDQDTYNVRVSGNYNVTCEYHYY